MIIGRCRCAGAPSAGGSLALVGGCSHLCINCQSIFCYSKRQKVNDYHSIYMPVYFLRSATMWLTGTSHNRAYPGRKVRRYVKTKTRRNPTPRLWNMFCTLIGTIQCLECCGWTFVQLCPLWLNPWNAQMPMTSRFLTPDRIIGCLIAVAEIRDTLDF